MISNLLILIRLISFVKTQVQIILLNFHVKAKIQINLLDFSCLNPDANVLGAIFILRKDIGVGGWSRKWLFSLTLWSKNVLGGWVVQKSLETPLRNMKMAP